ncbi:D-arabinono-1,4-lactone oxidase [Galbitalea sp. SE-J8]|nr:D-arabinono-1,4-lactone oxidase [Galbitalea sp. SE-J8]MDM4763415.1 D-arabinono-1,4-lactone oxidase [Galbitalea sp. SE-J8]
MATLGPSRRWRNWGRTVEARPAAVASPASPDEVAAVIRTARERGLPVKAVGAGHSFTAIAATDGVQLDISAIDGVLAVDGTRVRLGAGTNLYQLPALLAPHGLALANMGDIDRQTIAGATATGTHGTGLRFGGLATQIRAATLVTASGDLLRVSESENAELLPAVRIGLGALGILVDVTIECVPAYLLHAVERGERLDAVLDEWLDRVEAADHFEFYAFPHADGVSTKTNTRLPADAERHPAHPVSNWIEEVLVQSGVIAAMCQVSRVVPDVLPPLHRLATTLQGNRDFTDASPAVFTSPRYTRFREMEYALPVEAVPDALRAVKRMIAERDLRIGYPIEVRAAAADDIWLSTAHGRRTGYIAVHHYFRQDPTRYFREVEAIMRSFDGRPHWGKMHVRDAGSLAAAYPRFADFLAVRDRLDPERVFRNDYLTRVLGV